MACAKRATAARRSAFAYSPRASSRACTRSRGDSSATTPRMPYRTHCSRRTGLRPARASGRGRPGSLAHPRQRLPRPWPRASAGAEEVSFDTWMSSPSTAGSRTRIRSLLGLASPRLPRAVRRRGRESGARPLPDRYRIPICSSTSTDSRRRRWPRCSTPRWARCWHSSTAAASSSRRSSGTTPAARSAPGGVR